MSDVLVTLGDVVSSLGNNRGEESVGKRARVNPSKYWVATLFGVSADELIELLEHDTRYVIGNEICPTTERRHLQCFFIFSKRVRPLEKMPELKGKGRFERMKGKPEQAAKYCIKEGKYMQFMMEDLIKFKSNETIIEEIRIYMEANSELVSLKDRVYRKLYKGMFIEKNIKPIWSTRGQKEFCQMIWDMAGGGARANQFDWYEPEL